MPVSAVSRHRLLDLFIEMEAALKQRPRYQQGQDGERTSADWHRFARDIGPQLRERVAADLRQVLITRPAMQEIFVDGLPVYDEDTPALEAKKIWTGSATSGTTKQVVDAAIDVLTPSDS